jgi:hypothetical protein
MTRDEITNAVTNSFGPASDGGQLSQNIALAQRITAALIALDLIKPSAEPARAATQQDQPKKEDAERRKPRDPVA